MADLSDIRVAHYGSGYGYVIVGLFFHDASNETGMVLLNHAAEYNAGSDTLVRTEARLGVPPQYFEPHAGRTAITTDRVRREWIRRWAHDQIAAARHDDWAARRLLADAQAREVQFEYVLRDLGMGEADR